MKYRVLFKEHDLVLYVGDIFVGEADKLSDARTIAKRDARDNQRQLHLYHVTTNQRLFPHAGESA